MYISCTRYSIIQEELWEVTILPIFDPMTMDHGIASMIAVSLTSILMTFLIKHSEDMEIVVPICYFIEKLIQQSNPGKPGEDYLVKMIYQSMCKSN